MRGDPGLPCATGLLVPRALGFVPYSEPRHLQPRCALPRSRSWALRSIPPVASRWHPSWVYWDQIQGSSISRATSGHHGAGTHRGGGQGTGRDPGVPHTGGGLGLPPRPVQLCTGHPSPLLVKISDCWDMTPPATVTSRRGEWGWWVPGATGTPGGGHHMLMDGSQGGSHNPCTHG